MTTLPALRPLGRHKAYYDELKAIQAQHGAAILADVQALKINGKLTLGRVVPVALRYRLKLAALFTLLEDANVVSTGMYDRLKDSNYIYSDGTTGRFAPMRLLSEYIETYGLPPAVEGCEVEEPTL